jgi:nucleotide-binding universal stress UspA family protein
VTYRHLLLPIDGSKLSEEAAAAGIALAKALGARVTALHVLPEPATSGLEVWVHGDEEFEERLDKTFEAHGRKGPDAVLLASETLNVMTLGALPVLVHRSPSR